MSLGWTFISRLMGVPFGTRNRSTSRSRQIGEFWHQLLQHGEDVRELAVYSGYFDGLGTEALLRPEKLCHAIFVGRHAAGDLWDQVQAILAENRVDRATGADAKQTSLLAGLIFDEFGERLTPSHAVKGTRYRYYVSRSLVVWTAKDNSAGRRIPAANLEALVITKLRSFLADEGAILDAIRHEYAEGNAQARLIARGRKIAKEIETLTPDQIRAMLMTLISRIDIRLRLRRDQCPSISPSRAARVRLDRACDERDARQRG